VQIWAESQLPHPWTFQSAGGAELTLVLVLAAHKPWERLARLNVMRFAARPSRQLFLALTPSLSARH